MAEEDIYNEENEENKERPIQKYMSKENMKYFLQEFVKRINEG